MKRIVTSLILMLLFQNGQTQIAIDAKTSENIDVILKLTQTEKMIDAVLANMEKGMKQGMSAATQGKPLSAAQQSYTDAFSKEMMNTMRTMLAFEKLRPMVSQAYAETYTADEIVRIRKLYESEDSKMLVSKQSILMDKTNQATMKLITPAVQAMTQKMETLLATMPK